MTQEKYKILVFGASSINQKSILSHFAKPVDLSSYSLNNKKLDGLNINPKYIYDNFENKIGVKFYLYENRINKKEFIFQLWDFQDDEKFEFLHKQYYEGALGALVLVDFSKPDSLELTFKHVKNLRFHSYPFILIYQKSFSDSETINWNNYIKKIGAYQNYELDLKNIGILDKDIFKKEIEDIFSEFVKLKKQKPLIFKICIFGEESVGKSTFLNKYWAGTSISEKFNDSTQDKMGIKFTNIHISIEGREIIFQIWNFTGEEKFKFLYKDYMIGTKGAIILYDITRKKSLKKLDKWLKLINAKKYNIPILVIGNKVDLQAKRQISYEEASKLTISRNLIGPIEISAKDSTKKEQVLRNFAQIIMKKNPYSGGVGKTDLFLKIVILLKIHKVLNLKELSYHLDKSKATLSRYTRELIRLKMIDSYTKDEPQAGTIKRKYFTLNENFNYLIFKEKFSSENIESIREWDVLLQILSQKSYIFKIFQNISNTLVALIDDFKNALLTGVIKDDIPDFEFINLLASNLGYKTYNIRFLTENQIEKVRLLNIEYHKKLDEILKDDDEAEKPIIFFDFLLDINNLMKYKDHS